jgi:membrane protein YqaA with SNARE-associated domain
MSALKHARLDVLAFAALAFIGKTDRFVMVFRRTR